jgi:hypothetical protein
MKSSSEEEFQDSIDDVEYVDESVALVSSINLLCEHINSRHKRYTKENGKLRIVVKEAEGILRRVEEMLSRLSQQMLSSSHSVSSSEVTMIQELRQLIHHNRWIFEMPCDFTARVLFYQYIMLY